MQHNLNFLKQEYHTLNVLFLFKYTYFQIVRYSIFKFLKIKLKKKKLAIIKLLNCFAIVSNI